MTFWDYYFSLLQYDLASKETQSLVWYCLCQLLESRMVSVYNYGFMNNLLLHSRICYSRGFIALECNYTAEWIKPLIDFLYIAHFSSSFIDSLCWSTLRHSRSSLCPPSLPLQFLVLFISLPSPFVLVLIRLRMHLLFMPLLLLVPLQVNTRSSPRTSVGC